MILYSRTILRALVVLAVGCHLNAAQEEVNKCHPAANAPPDCPSPTQTANPVCSLYLAESSIPNAGFGIYTAVDRPAGSVISDDLVVPIIDGYKTLPFRGQERFLSWLGYVWPQEKDWFYNTYEEDAHPLIPESRYLREEGLNGADGLDFSLGNQKVSVFSPGIASLANSHQDLANVFMGEVDAETASFASNEDLQAGSELFLDYGDTWHDRRYEKHKNGVEDYRPHEGWVKQESSSTVQRREEEEVKVEETQNGVRNLHWLQEHGVCLDLIRVGPSTVHGRGAFSKTSIAKGSVIAPAPLLALKRDDLVIYKVDEDAETLRETMDFENVVGQEKLRNFCYGHADSPMLLLPYSPIVNYINHDSKPNAEIRWSSKFGDANEWLSLHPLDVLNQEGGKLLMEFVALRDIKPNEEIYISYGAEWEKSWKNHMAQNGRDSGFYHEIGVPEDFYPEKWLHTSAVYQVAPPEAPLQPGQVEQLKFAHNGQPITKNAFRVGLPKGFSAHMKEYADSRGITELYQELLYGEPKIEDNDFDTFSTHGETWFRHRFMSGQWNFNMYYVAAWDELARISFLRALGSGGFDTALDGMGNHMGLDNMTCFHVSFMGVNQCDSSRMHADILASGEKGVNFVWPLILVDGSPPELDVQGDDANIVVKVNYEYDVAYVLGDWAYHRTAANSYADTKQMRLVAAAYCAQMDESSVDLLAHIYKGEWPAPFHDQFELPIREYHWGRYSLPK